MKFLGFKEFKNLSEDTFNDVIEYLKRDLVTSLRDLKTGLNNLKFTDNFNSFKVVVDLPVGTEVAIRNELRNKVPTERIILRGDAGGITDGDTQWNLNYVYLKNTGATAKTVTVLFLE